jgi:UDP-GlcNAc3NAcA epimerase
LKILTVLGARPQFIKAIALSRAVAARPGATEVIVHTGQHYDDNMSEVFFRELGIPEPSYRLGIGGGRHGDMTGRQMIALEPVLEAEKPDFCLVYGDTNSTLAAALTAAKLGVPVAHVEAGLRSFNRAMPEEINRVLTDHVSDLLFAPTPSAIVNLEREGIGGDKVIQSGDVMYDVARLFIDEPERRTDIATRLALPARYCVATLHRQENTDNRVRLVGILRALVELSRELAVVLPLHPRTAKMIAADSELKALVAALTVTEPLGFSDMATLVSGATLVVTDSGGLQKEAYFHGVPAVTVRDETEWVELVEAGWNRLPVALETASIMAAIREALASPAGQSIDTYGEGRAAELILDVLLDRATRS